MIHRDLCDPAKTKYWSPLRMKMHFVLSRFVCDGGFVPLTKRELAEELSCSLQSVHKHLRRAEKEGVISIVGETIYLKKYVPSEEYRGGYVKHFPFLESEPFIALNPQTQRFILYALWTGVYNTGMKLERSIDTLYHHVDQRNGVLNLYSRQPALDVLEESKVFLKFAETKKDLFKVVGLQEQFNVGALENQGERKWLEDLLITSTCDVVSEKTKQNILTIKSEYFRTLGSIGLELFSHALDKLLLSFNLYQLESRGEVGKVLRTNLRELEEKILPQLQKRVEYTKQAFEASKRIIQSKTAELKLHFGTILGELNKALSVLWKDKPVHHPNGPNPFPFYNWLENN